jgi:hypothetical protein
MFLWAKTRAKKEKKYQNPTTNSKPEQEARKCR